MHCIRSTATSIIHWINMTFGRNHSTPRTEWPHVVVGVVCTLVEVSIYFSMFYREDRRFMTYDLWWLTSVSEALMSCTSQVPQWYRISSSSYSSSSSSSLSTHRHISTPSSPTATVGREYVYQVPVTLVHSTTVVTLYRLPPHWCRAARYRLVGIPAPPCHRRCAPPPTTPTQRWSTFCLNFPSVFIWWGIQSVAFNGSIYWVTLFSHSWPKWGISI